jgi:hypothetical protein
MDYLHTYEASSSWETFTDTATIEIPKHIIAKDLNGNDVPLVGTNINIGSGDNPLFLKGDKISIQAGYWYVDELGQERQDVNVVFQGFITAVHSKLRIKLECDDFMYILKQVPVPNGVWNTAKNGLAALVKQWIAGTAAERAGVTVNMISKYSFSYNVGVFQTRNETVAQVLARLKNEGGVTSYFKGSELRIGYPTYRDGDIQNPGKPYIFDKNINIISDELKYARKDDLVLSAVATRSYGIQSDDTDDNGNAILKKVCETVFVYVDKQTQAIKSKVLKKGEKAPPNVEGQRFMWDFMDCSTTQELIKRATDELQKRYYTGFYGSFVTFGMPFIPVGDNIKLKDRSIPDKDGVYKVKSVKYTGGVGIGIKQEIFLHYKINE